MTDRITRIATLAFCTGTVWATLAAFRTPACVQAAAVAWVILIVSAFLVGAMAEDRKFREEMEDE